MPDAQVLNIAQLMSTLLTSESQVVQSYAAATLEKMLTKKSEVNQNQLALTDKNTD